MCSPNGGFMDKVSFTAEEIIEIRRHIMNAITQIAEVDHRVPYDVWLVVQDLKEEMYKLCSV